MVSRGSTVLRVTDSLSLTPRMPRNFEGQVNFKVSLQKSFLVKKSFWNLQREIGKLNRFKKRYD